MIVPRKIGEIKTAEEKFRWSTSEKVKKFLFSKIGQENRLNENAGGSKADDKVL